MKKGTYNGHPLRSEILEQLRYGCHIRDVCTLLGVSYSFVKYHIDKEWRERQKERTLECRNRRRLRNGYYPMSDKEILEDKFETIINQLKKKL